MFTNSDHIVTTRSYLVEYASNHHEMIRKLLLLE